jgi:hypothetical protein
MILTIRFRRSRIVRTGLTSRRTSGLAHWPLLLALLLAVGCERPTAVQTADAAPTDQHQVPFHAAPTTPGASPDGSQVAQVGPETSLPFQEARNLPAGTLLTVRLKYPISAENPGEKETFEAVMDEPVVIEGNRLVPRGTSVAGRVESVQSSNVGRNRGYVRLALDSIHLAGANLSVQTSSLFVKGNASASAPQGDDQRDAQEAETHPAQPQAGVIRLEKGRRLTFRLTEPAYVAASQRTPADR